MRLAYSGPVLACVLLSSSCGGDSGSGPDDPFPDASGVYSISGGFDDLPRNDGSFTGTIEIAQASRQSGALTGTAAITADIGGDVFNVTDDAIGGASVSTADVITFTLNNGGTGTWTFTGTLSGNNVTGGRHTLSGSSDNLSGDW